MNLGRDSPSSRSNATTTSARSNATTTSARSNATTTSARSNATTTSARSNATTPIAPQVIIRRRGNNRFPQPKISPIPENIQVLFSSYCEAVETVCLRNIGLRCNLGSVEMRKCYPDQCGCVHLDRDIRLCNSFIEYLRANVANGIDCLSAAQSCQHNHCKYWPCNLITNKKILNEKVNIITPATKVAAASSRMDAPRMNAPPSNIGLHVDPVASNRPKNTVQSSNIFNVLNDSDESKLEAPPSSFAAIMALQKLEPLKQPVEPLKQSVSMALPRHNVLNKQPEFNDTSTVSFEEVPFDFYNSVKGTCLKNVVLSLKRKLENNQSFEKMKEQQELTKHEQKMMEQRKKYELEKQYAPPKPSLTFLELLKAVEPKLVEVEPKLVEEVNYKCTRNSYHTFNCQLVHSNVKQCNHFAQYVLDNWTNPHGISYRDAYNSCRNESCEYWPCNLVNKLQFAVEIKAVKAKKAAEVAKKLAEITTIAAPSTFPEMIQEKCKIKADKTEISLTNPLLYKVWCERKYNHLSLDEFFKKFHKDYSDWNKVDVDIIFRKPLFRKKKDNDDWTIDNVEIEKPDHRCDFADFQAAVLGITLPHDERVLGSTMAAEVAKNSKIFSEYIRDHWNFAGRPQTIGEIVTFHQWLEMHPKKVAIKRVNKRVSQEAVDWNDPRIEFGNGYVVDKDESKDESKENVYTTSLFKMSAPVESQVDTTSLFKMSAPVESRVVKKEYGAGKKLVKNFKLPQGPDFLKDIKENERIFVCKNDKGFFEIFIKLAKKLEATDATDISKVWSNYRSGPGRASFVQYNGDFLRIYGTMRKGASTKTQTGNKKKSFKNNAVGFYEMFENFPNLITELKNKRYIATGELYAVPVVMQKSKDTKLYTYFLGTDRKMFLLELEQVVEKVKLDVDESDNESNGESDDDFDDESDDDFDTSTISVLADIDSIKFTKSNIDDDDFDSSTVGIQADIASSFEFTESNIEDEAVFELKFQTDTDAYALVEILAMYFKNTQKH